MSRFIDIHTHHPTHFHREPQAEGRHPWDAELLTPISISDNTKIIGEIGLDFACNVDRKKQEEVFRQQLTIAQSSNRPVVLHCVKAFEQIMKILDDYTLKAVIFHGFIGSPQQAASAIKKGYFISFGGRTKKSPKTIEALRSTPIDYIFAETDEGPDKIEDIYEMIASIKETTTDEIIDAIEKNYTRIFNSDGE